MNRLSKSARNPVSGLLTGVTECKGPRTSNLAVHLLGSKVNGGLVPHVQLSGDPFTAYYPISWEMLARLEDGVRKRDGL